MSSATAGRCFAQLHATHTGKIKYKGSLNRSHTSTWAIVHSTSAHTFFPIPSINRFISLGASSSGNRTPFAPLTGFRLPATVSAPLLSLRCWLPVPLGPCCAPLQGLPSELTVRIKRPTMGPAWPSSGSLPPPPPTPPPSSPPGSLPEGGCTSRPCGGGISAVAMPVAAEGCLMGSCAMLRPSGAAGLMAA